MECLGEISLRNKMKITRKYDAISLFQANNMNRFLSTLQGITSEGFANESCDDGDVRN